MTRKVTSNSGFVRSADFLPCNDDVCDESHYMGQPNNEKIFVDDYLGRLDNDVTFVIMTMT